MHFGIGLDGIGAMTMFFAPSSTSAEVSLLWRTYLGRILINLTSDAGQYSKVSVTSSPILTISEVSSSGSMMISLTHIRYFVIKIVPMMICQS